VATAAIIFTAHRSIIPALSFSRRPEKSN